MATGEWGGALSQRVFRAIISFRRGQQQCQTGFHLRDVGINTLSPEEVATEVADFATTEFIKILHTADTVTGIDVENLVSREGFSVSPSNVAGVVPGDPAPSYIMVSVALKGSIRRRYGSGRMLWPVPHVGGLAGNQLAPGSVAIYQGILNDMLDRWVGSSITTNMHLVHLHAALPAAQNRPAVPASWYDITSARLNTTLSALRRRKAGVGS